MVPVGLCKLPGKDRFAEGVSEELNDQGVSLGPALPELSDQFLVKARETEDETPDMLLHKVLVVLPGQCGDCFNLCLGFAAPKGIALVLVAKNMLYACAREAV